MADSDIDQRESGEYCDEDITAFKPIPGDVIPSEVAPGDSTGESAIQEHNMPMVPISKEAKVEAYRHILQYLQARSLTWGGLIEYIADPNSNEASTRRAGFFDDPELVHRVLNYWVSWRNARPSRKIVHDWIMAYVRKQVVREGNKVTKEGILQSRKMVIDESFVLRFNLSNMYEKLRHLCPSMTMLAEAFSRTTRQDRKAKEYENDASKQRHQKRVGSAILTMLGERSQRNSYAKHIVGLYLYATGAQRQAISVLASLGVCSSYPTLAGTKTKLAEDVRASNAAANTSSQLDLSSAEVAGNRSQDQEFEGSDLDEEGEAEETSSEQETGSQCDSNIKAGDEHDDGRQEVQEATSADASRRVSTMLSSNAEDGLLKRLCEACRATTRHIASIRMLGLIYDNINMVFKVAEQRVTQKDTQQNGTCATVFPLYDAKPEDMKTADLLTAHEQAPLLSADDILHTSEEAALYRQCLIHTILRIIVSYGGEQFNKFRSEVARTLPVTDEQIPVHQTDIYPLPAMHIDESSITGNGEVLEAMFQELNQDMSQPEFGEHVRLIGGDQLSLSRVRSLFSHRIGHDHFNHSMANVASMLGLFHGQIHLVCGLILTHWGNSSLGARDPGSLSFHNIILGRKPIVLSSLPPYRTLRDLLFVSAYGRILHNVELIAGKSLAEVAESASFQDLEELAAQVLDRFASGKVVDQLRESNDESESDSEPPLSASDVHDGSTAEGEGKGRDMVFENAVLFLRDALIAREFTDAIKAGDSGRVVLSLKMLALVYRGTGRTKYAQETLFVIHNITHVWPKPLRHIILNNWLVNPTGRANSFVPIDLLQEHNNFWIKVMYAAQGSAASWEWLATISPCIMLLRSLATQMNDTLGSKQGTKHHSPNLDKDIQEIMKSLRMHEVYVYHKEGRPIEGKGGEVKDVIAEGVIRLGSALKEYNTTFERLRARRTVPPLIGPVPVVMARGTPAESLP
ncbi:hypothetical protein NM688_g2309 [Phlebia brevispora]|uniref:Uncharacterized protein n=1 Tax=Phlebia brevispora TaxID=194682 RepID=A0ACC1T8R6_9APHY|nr:hypothetical protein NM688_g2309 [Phlebia brevispora]